MFAADSGIDVLVGGKEAIALAAGNGRQHDCEALFPLKARLGSFDIVMLQAEFEAGPVAELALQAHNLAFGEGVVGIDVNIIFELLFVSGVENVASGELVAQLQRLDVVAQLALRLAIAVEALFILGSKEHLFERRVAQLVGAPVITGHLDIGFLILQIAATPVEIGLQIVIDTIIGDKVGSRLLHRVLETVQDLGLFLGRVWQTGRQNVFCRVKIGVTNNF